jgi:hypothetical protein
MTTLRQAVTELRSRHGSRLTDLELGLLAVAWLDDQPLQIDTNDDDRRSLHRAVTLVQRGADSRAALAAARGSAPRPDADPSKENCSADASGAWWECPCSSEPPRGSGGLTALGTVVSLREPHCPWCGCAYQEAYRSDNTTSPLTKALRRRRPTQDVQIDLLADEASVILGGPTRPPRIPAIASCPTR